MWRAEARRARVESFERVKGGEGAGEGEQVARRMRWGEGGWGIVDMGGVVGLGGCLGGCAAEGVNVSVCDVVVKVGCRGLEGFGEEWALELSIYRAVLKSSDKSHKTGDHPGLRR